ALVLRDDQARVVDVNPAFLQISGYTREEVVSGTRWIFALPEMAELAREMHRRTIAGESVHFEMKARHKDGTLIDVEMRAVPIVYRGKPHALGMARDITAQKRAERERALRERRPGDEVFRRPHRYAGGGRQARIDGRDQRHIWRPLRAPDRARYRKRHRAQCARAHLRSVLHHQGRRHWYRIGLVAGARHR